MYKGQAFKAIRASSGRKPAEVDSDGGAEFGAAFTKMLEDGGIGHRVKRLGHTNAIAVVDSAINASRRLCDKTWWRTPPAAG